MYLDHVWVRTTITSIVAKHFAKGSNYFIISNLNKYKHFLGITK